MAAPSVLSRQASVSSTTDATSFTPTLPTVTTGKLLLAVVSIDQNPTPSTTSTGWALYGFAVNGTTVTGAVFVKRVATGSDALVVKSSSSQQFSAEIFCIDPGSAFFDIALTSANGSSTNSNPPSLSLYTSLDALWIATRSGDSTVVATAAPSGYSNLQTQAAAGTSGASTNTAEKTSTASSEDPGTFTSATEQWVSWTIGVHADTQSRWSAGDKNNNVALSNSNLTATGTAQPTNTNGVRSTLGHSSGKWVCAINPTSIKSEFGTDNEYLKVGLANNLWAPDDSGNLGDAVNSFSIRNAAGTLTLHYNAGDTTFTGNLLVEGSPFFIAYDIGTGDVWVKSGVSGTWSGNPDAGTGGVNVPMPGVIFGVAGLDGDGAGNYDAATWDGTASGHGLTTFTPWDTVASSAYTLTASPGSYALTGTAVTFKRGRVLAASAGSYTLSGTAAALKRGWTLSAASGAYSLTGTAAGLRFGRVLAASAGSYALTGTAATLTYTSSATSYVLTATPGAYTQTGTAASLLAGRKISAAAGAYILTGQAATLSRGRKITASPGSYALTGTDLSFARSYVLASEPGSYLLTGASITLTWSGESFWRPVTPTGEAWTAQPVTAETWTPIASTSNPWTSQ